MSGDTVTHAHPVFPGIATLERELGRLRDRQVALNVEAADLREEIDALKHAIDVLRQWTPPVRPWEGGA